MTGQQERLVAEVLACAVAIDINYWNATSRQSNSKCLWQCCQMSKTNSFCLWRWTKESS